jgi:hypothetical protein
MKIMKNKRVGTISMAIVLIALGVLIFYSQINKVSTLNIALKLWPLILILLGLEILYYRFIYKEDVIVKYDVWSIFIVFAILIANLGIFAMTETGLLSKIRVYAVTDDYHFDMDINEYTVGENIKKIILDESTDKLSIRAVDNNIITGSAKVDISATSKEEALKYRDEELFQFKEVGDTIYVSLKENRSNPTGYLRPYDISLNLPKDIDVELRNCYSIDLVYDNFRNNFILDNISRIDMRLNSENDIKVKAYVESEDFLRGNVDWKFDEYGEYINGEGSKLINILNSDDITVDII